MKIAFIVRHYSKTGGISRYVAELVERFIQNNEVHIFTSSWRDVKNDNIVFHKVPILSFDILKKYKKHAWNNLFEVASFMVFSYFIVNYNDFDIVHAQGDFIGKSDIYTAHSCHKAWLNIVQKEKLSLIERIKKSSLNPLHYVVLSIEKYNVKQTNKIIAISFGIKKEIIKYYNASEKSMVVIPNGVNLDESKLEDKKALRKAIRKKYGISKENVVLLFVGHEFDRKGLKYIIKALGILKKLKLFVVGKDDPMCYLSLAEKLGVRNQVIFIGATSEVKKYYAASDVFVFPTLYEPFGLVILEAMAYELPVLTTDIPGPNELIKNEVNGFFIKRESHDIAKKIEILSQDKELLKKMGEEARKTAEKYSWDIIAEKTFKLYKEMKL